MEQISKKDLLLQTGISYGQLYRWKREGLIPEEWFVKQSAFTGQETFFPREQILGRIRSILNMKGNHSLDELALMLSPTAAVLPLDAIDELSQADKAALQQAEKTTLSLPELSLFLGLRQACPTLSPTALTALGVGLCAKPLTDGDWVCMVFTNEQCLLQLGGTLRISAGLQLRTSFSLHTVATLLQEKYFGKRDA